MISSSTKYLSHFQLAEHAAALGLNELLPLVELSGSSRTGFLMRMSMWLLRWCVDIRRICHHCTHMFRSSTQMPPREFLDFEYSRNL